MKEDYDEIDREMVMESSSPEAKLGRKVEDLWDNQGSQLSPTEKLNACFEDISVSSFPLASDSQGFFVFLSFCSVVDLMNCYSPECLILCDVDIVYDA